MPATAADVLAPANYWHDKHLCHVTRTKKEDGRIYIEWTEEGIFCSGSFRPGAYFGEQANILP
jgi:hypothetical protein